MIIKKKENVDPFFPNPSHYITEKARSRDSRLVLSVLTLPAAARSDGRCAAQAGCLGIKEERVVTYAGFLQFIEFVKFVILMACPPAGCEETLRSS
jgi:hypothetical protein